MPETDDGSDLSTESTHTTEDVNPGRGQLPDPEDAGVTGRYLWAAGEVQAGEVEGGPDFLTPIYKLDFETGEVIDRTNIDQFEDIAGMAWIEEDAELWFHDDGTRLFLMELPFDADETMARFRNEAVARGGGLAWTGDRLLSVTNDEVLSIDRSTGATSEVPSRSLPLFAPQSVTYSDTHLWIFDFDEVGDVGLFKATVDTDVVGESFISLDFAEREGLAWVDGQQELLSSSEQLQTIDPSSGSVSAVSYNIPEPENPIAMGANIRGFPNNIPIIQDLTLFEPSGGSSTPDFPRIPIDEETEGGTIRYEDQLTIHTNGRVNQFGTPSWPKGKALLADLGADWEEVLGGVVPFEDGTREYEVLIRTLGEGTKRAIDVDGRALGTRDDGDVVIFQEETFQPDRGRPDRGRKKDKEKGETPKSDTSSVTYEPPVVYETKGTTPSKENGWFRVTAYGLAFEGNFSGSKISKSKVNFTGGGPKQSQFKRRFLYGAGGGPNDCNGGVCFQGSGVSKSGEIINFHDAFPIEFSVEKCPKTKTGTCAQPGIDTATDDDVIPRVNRFEFKNAIRKVSLKTVSGKSLTVDFPENKTGLSATDSGSQIENRDVDLFMGRRNSALKFGERLKKVIFCGGDCSE